MTFLDVTRINVISADTRDKYCICVKCHAANHNILITLCVQRQKRGNQLRLPVTTEAVELLHDTTTTTTTACQTKDDFV